ncbi:MAG: glycosyltransferase family 2 protein [Faecalibacterium sp.]
MQSKVSVIIPVYNTKEYLTECVNSVYKQCYSNIEILLIDDGSTDGSGVLCDEYAAQYSTAEHPIIVVHQQNAGLSAARNTGIKHATGDYLLFLDSDDYYLNKNAISTLAHHATTKNIDVLCFNYTRSNTHTPERYYPEAFSNNLSQLITDNVYTSSACLKFIRAEILHKHNIFFIVGQRSEDVLFSGKLLATEDISFAFLNEVLYFYRVRKVSLTHTLKLDHITTTVSILHSLLSLTGANHTNTYTPNTQAAKNLLAYTAFQYATLLINIHRSAEKIPADCLAEIYQMKYLLQYNPTGIVRLISLCSKCVGVRATSHLMAFAFRVKEVLHK